LRTKEKRGTLLWVLDRTKTAMGARLLRKWLEQPLVSVGAILNRQQAVAELADGYIEKEELQNLLGSVGDLERLMTKIVYNTAGGKDLRALYQTISVLAPVREQLKGMVSPELAKLHGDLDELSDIGAYIDRAIVEEPPFSIREGGFIKKGFSPEIDELNAIQADGKSWIASVEQSERELTGIKGLKIGYNRVFGYYIEVTNSYKEQVPDRYIRKQTLTGCERYITQELKDMEAKILGAKDKVCALEYEEFQKLRSFIAENVLRVQKTADILSKLDVYVSLADVAVRNNYVCPEVDASDAIVIKDGRHPVVEKFLKNEMFVPNDVNLNESERLMLITGPNMAGKSTYMRQTALIILMAQIGPFVPASSARIGVVDKLFTRIGASDDLAAGQSTFMLEMTECAYILKNATARSFILYDEIGRGTSTYDGMSIARAIIEYTVSKKLYAKTMFATHYHELTELEDLCRGVVNYNIVAKKRGDELIFLRKIVRGAADESYGIEVAKLAGVPDEVVKRAGKILASIDEHAPVDPKKNLLPKTDGGIATLGLETIVYDKVCEDIKKLDVNTLTPIEALGKLYEMKKILEGAE
ncbi:MAG: DNA mismatch repair protein MutS, partial [Eubacteriales bacterium]